MAPAFYVTGDYGGALHHNWSTGVPSTLYKHGREGRTSDNFGLLSFVLGWFRTCVNSTEGRKVARTIACDMNMDA